MVVLGEALLKAKPVDTVVGKVDCTKENSVCSKYGVTGYPTIKFFKKGSETPEDYQGGRSADDFIDFLNNNAGTRLKKTSKPEEAVLTLTPSNFDKVVMDTGKDVLVEFYAPWCGHCKTLAPIYEKVAHAFKLENNVVIAKLNADAHKDLAERYGVKGFPTLKFFPKGDKKGEDAQRHPDVAGFISFLNSKCKTHRKENGHLDDSAGLKTELNILAKKFFASSNKDEQNSIITETSKIVSNDKNYEFYLRVMTNVQARGAEYVKTEHKRLSKMLDSESVKGEQKDSFSLRINVLAQFK